MHARLIFLHLGQSASARPDIPTVFHGFARLRRRMRY
jgi:hypothetical protein